jgi:GNAT superfamily N-acetyltransferase
VLASATHVDLQDLAAFLTPFYGAPGTVLIRRGDVAEHFMLVIAGQAKVVFGEEGEISPAMARYLTEIDYIDHFTWVAVDGADVSVGGATYVRSTSGSALADISFGIMDQFQGRGLGTLLMGAIARRNGISRFSADVLAENTPMRAILHRAGIEWEPVKRGVAHGTLEVPDPGTFGIPPMTAAALGDAADEVAIRAWHSLATPASPLPPPGTC